MKQSLDIKLGQHLTITPQLQQAIRLLQLSSLELQQEIQQALEANPLLEEREDDERPEGEAASDEEVSTETKDEAETDSDSDSGEIEMESAELSDDMGMDSDWEEVFDTSTAPNPRNEDGPDLEARNSLPISLRDHLLWQLQMTALSARDKSIAMALIDAIDDDGYLKTTLEEIQQALGGEAEVDLSEVEAVLHQIQNFEPAGVAARNLSECLLLQMRGLPTDTPNLPQARALIQPEHLDLLAARDQARLRRALKFTPEELTAALTLVQQLNPRPGTGWAHTQSNYIVPDVIVRKVRGIWRAELNADTAPKLRVNPYYEKMVQRGDSSPQNKYLQEHLQEARWFIKSLNSRNDTLLKVARTIVDRQRAFFDHGPEAMKPLVLHDIAQTVQMHESTISRVTTQKYMLTPRGIFELKYFFSSHVGTVDGGTCSATAIRSLIKRLVEKEAPSKPISDSKIAEMLEAQGINVARRTVAKYRESLNIPPSSQRKSLV